VGQKGWAGDSGFGSGKRAGGERTKKPGGRLAGPYTEGNAGVGGNHAKPRAKSHAGGWVTSKAPEKGGGNCGPRCEG